MADYSDELRLDNAPFGHRWCKECQTWQLPEKFKLKSGKYKLLCESCRAGRERARSAQRRKDDPTQFREAITRYRRSTKGKRNVRERHLKRKYNISHDEYDRMLHEQAGCCAICGNQEHAVHHETGSLLQLAVDHNHETGKLCRLLCRRCNMTLGLLQHDSDLAAKVALYLNEFHGKGERS